MGDRYISVTSVCVIQASQIQDGVLIADDNCVIIDSDENVNDAVSSIGFCFVWFNFLSITNIDYDLVRNIP